MNKKIIAKRIKIIFFVLLYIATKLTFCVGYICASDYAYMHSPTFYCYDDVDTGKQAIDESIASNVIFPVFNRLNIDGTVFVPLNKDNYKFHASDYAKIGNAYANFGIELRYTLYEVESALKFKVLADNSTRKLYCPINCNEEFVEYYSDYNNFDFIVRVDDDKTNYIMRLEEGVYSNIENKYVVLDNCGGNKSNPVTKSISKKSVIQISITPISKDHLVEGDENSIFYYNGQLYWKTSESDKTLSGIKLSDDDNVCLFSALKPLIEKSSIFE